MSPQENVKNCRNQVQQFYTKILGTNRPWSTFLTSNYAIPLKDVDKKTWLLEAAHQLVDHVGG